MRVHAEREPGRRLAPVRGRGHGPHVTAAVGQAGQPGQAGAVLEPVGEVSGRYPVLTGQPGDQAGVDAA